MKSFTNVKNLRSHELTACVCEQMDGNVDVIVSKTTSGKVQVVFKDTTSGKNTLALQLAGELKEELQTGEYNCVVMVTDR